MDVSDICIYVSYNIAALKLRVDEKNETMQQEASGNDVTM
jgi:hypothetical protein